MLVQQAFLLLLLSVTQDLVQLPSWRRSDQSAVSRRHSVDRIELRRVVVFFKKVGSRWFANVGVVLGLI